MDDAPPVGRRLGSDGAVTRRAWIGGAVAVGAGFALPRAAADPPAAARTIPSRPFGRTGRTVSVLGLGCYYVGAARSDEEGAAVVEKALDLGVTYFDTAPSYLAGVSERRVGLGLAKRRDGVFLSTKTLERDGSAARRELEASLKRLRTDHVDLIQVHCVRDAADLERVLSPSGPLAALARAREEGLTRFVGVTAHEDPAIAKAAIEGWAWDSILMPLNPVDVHWRSFVDDALPAAVKSGLARVAMKVLASGRIVAAKTPGALSVEDCLRFAFGLDVSCAIVGCATVAEIETAARVAAEGQRLEAEGSKALVAAAKSFSGRPPRGVEWYKRAPETPDEQRK